MIAICIFLYDQYKANQEERENLKTLQIQASYNESSLKNQQEFEKQIQQNQNKFDSLTHSNQLNFEEKSQKNQANYERATIDGQKTQLEFEQAKLEQLLLPMIRDSSADVISKEFLLQSLMQSKVVNKSIAFELGKNFFRGGLPLNHAKNLFANLLPEGIQSFSDRGLELSYELKESMPSPFTVYNPVNGIEDFDSKKMEYQVKELRLLRSIIIENLNLFDNCKCEAINDYSIIPKYLTGLSILVQAKDKNEAIKISHSKSIAISIIGYLNRGRIDANDNEAINFIEEEIKKNACSYYQERLVNQIISIINSYKATAFSDILCKIATGDIYNLSVCKHNDIENVMSDYFWIRFKAGDALRQTGMNDKSNKTAISYLNKFYHDIQSTDSIGMDKLSIKYEAAKIVRLLVFSVKLYGSNDGKRILDLIAKIDENKMRYFPFLKDDIKFN